MPYPTQDPARYGGERPEPPYECADCSQLIEDRDIAQDAADKLADAIATLFGEEIGEHSNLNCPWYNALEIIEGAIRNKQPT